jgi:hypothetical protein
MGTVLTLTLGMAPPTCNETLLVAVINTANRPFFGLRP